MEAAHGAATFPDVPTGWYYLGRKQRFAAGPLRAEVGGREYVGFLSADGRPVTLDARCSHMRADLSRGTVVNGRLRCPLHGWEYGANGRCEHIPASQVIPPFACQPLYPTAEIGGHVVFCNAPAAPFPMPFFEDVSADELIPAPPFDLTGEAPWYLIGANGFDFQHFYVAHDRKLIDTPVIDTPAPYAWRIAATYEVTGNSFRDRLTRRLAGPRVRMTVTSYGGTNILVTAAFARTTTYGMVFVQPLSPQRTRLRVIVWVKRRRGNFQQKFLDPADALVRSWFIRRFLMEDTGPTAGIRYNPATLIDADRPMREYLDGLAMACNGLATTPRRSSDGHQ